jgi:hypothetical protein
MQVLKYLHKKIYINSKINNCFFNPFLKEFFYNPVFSE